MTVHTNLCKVVVLHNVNCAEFIEYLIIHVTHSSTSGIINSKPLSKVLLVFGNINHNINIYIKNIIAKNSLKNTKKLI